MTDDDAIPLRDFMATQFQSLVRQIDALSALTDAKFVTFRTLIDSQAEKVALALAAADKAVTKAEIATEKRFENVNEFRGQLADQAASFVDRRELQALQTAINLRLDGVVKDIGAIAKRIDTSEGRSKGISSSLGALVAAISVVVIVVNLGIYLLKG